MTALQAYGPRRLTAKRVRELLDCDPEAGTLRWKERPGNPSFNAPSRAGSRPGLQGISGRGHNARWSSRAIGRAERSANPGLSPTATAVIVTAQCGRMSMARRPHVALMGAISPTQWLSDR
jgi:hypothetical protein